MFDPEDVPTIDHGPEIDAFEADVDKGIKAVRVREEVKRRIAEQDIEDVDYEVLTLGDLKLRPKPPRGRAHGLLPWNGTTTIVAQNKTGKTTLTLNMIQSFLTGEKLLGKYDVVPLTGAVLYLSYEMDQDQFAEWANNLGIDENRLIVVSLRGVSNPFKSDMLKDKLLGKIKKVMVARGIDNIETVFLDTFGAAYTGASQNDNGEVTKFLQDVREFTQEGCGAKDLIISVHSGWGQAGQATHSRGASALEDVPDVVIYLDKDADGNRELSAKGRDVAVDKTLLEYSNGKLTMLEMSLKEKNARDKISSLRIPVLKIIKDNPKCSQSFVDSEIKNKLDPMTGNPYKLTNGDVAKVIKQLDKECKVVITKNGQKYEHEVIDLEGNI